MVPVAYVQSNQVQYKCSNNHYHNSVVFQDRKPGTTAECISSPWKCSTESLFCGLFDNHSMSWKVTWPYISTRKCLESPCNPTLHSGIPDIHEYHYLTTSTTLISDPSSPLVAVRCCQIPLNYHLTWDITWTNMIISLNFNSHYKLNFVHQDMCVIPHDVITLLSCWVEEIGMYVSLTCLGTILTRILFLIIGYVNFPLQKSTAWNTAIQVQLPSHTQHKRQEFQVEPTRKRYLALLPLPKSTQPK